MTRSRWSLLLLALVVSCLIATAVGTIPLSLAQLLRAMTGEGDALTVHVLRSLRLPRVSLAVLVGAGLGMSGAALQGSMRNALAEPYLLGVSGGAAVGAVTAVSIGAGAPVIPLAAFLGAVVAVIVAFFVAHASGARGDPKALLMAGVVVGAFANALIMIALANAEANTVRGALWWMMGSVADATWAQNAWLAAYIAVGGGLLVFVARRIDILTLGEDAAAGLGLDVDRSARLIYLLSAFVAASTVAAAGLVGFVGLITPHIVRRLGARTHRPLLVGSAIAGAALVVMSDLVARVLRPPAELPLGAVTAVIGVPFFLAQLRRFT